MCSQLSSSLEYYFDVPIDNLLICDANVDFGHDDNSFDVLDGNVDNFLFLSYLSGYNGSLGPYYIYLVDKPRKKSYGALSFYGFCFVKESTNFICYGYLNALLFIAL